eukprot:20751_1
MAQIQLATCQRCHTSFDIKSNTNSSCKFHRAMYVCRPHTEGKAYYGVDVQGWDYKCWECCGKEQPDAGPCAQGKHVSYDESWLKDDDLLNSQPIVKQNQNKKNIQK